MGSQRFCLLVQFLGFFLAPARGQMFFWDEHYEDDFVEVDFEDCPHCDQNYRNFVFLLDQTETTEEAASSIYPYVAGIMWLILAALVICQRLMQMKRKM
ncbi:hypothetical protein KR054_000307 [Drosophila jambulina]|nr:hypothetical protein KR054_000307 [Drosophila jambulina]